MISQILGLSLIIISIETKAQNCPTPANSIQPLQEAVNSISEQTLRRKVSTAEANALFEAAAHNPLFRMKDAGAFCYHRSQLLGKKLEDQGIYSEQLYINCFGEGIFAVDPFSKRPSIFEDHWVTLVNVEDPKNHKITQKVFDPQFKTEPMEIDTYLKSIMMPDFNYSHSKEIKNKSHLCTFRSVDRHDFQSLRHEVRIKNETLKKELGLIDERSGAEYQPDRKTKRKLKKESAEPAKWFDDRMDWNDENLVRMKKDIEKWNKMMTDLPRTETAITEKETSTIRKETLENYIQSLKKMNEEFINLDMSRMSTSPKDAKKTKNNRLKIYEEHKKSIEEMEKALIAE